jgi:hypothetical protein
MAHSFGSSVAGDPDSGSSNSDRWPRQVPRTVSQREAPRRFLAYQYSHPGEDVGLWGRGHGSPTEARCSSGEGAHAQAGKVCDERLRDERLRDERYATRFSLGAQSDS